MNSDIVIPTALLEAIARWAAPEDDMRSLSQVVFRDGEVIACDGIRLVRAPLAMSGPPFGIPRAACLAAVAAQDAWLRSDTRLATRPTSRSISIRYAHPVVRIAIDDGAGIFLTVAASDLADFPAAAVFDEMMAARSIDSRPSPDGIAFNPALLVPIGEVARAADRSGSPGVTVVKWGGPRDPVCFESDGDGGPVRYVVMPAVRP